MSEKDNAVATGELLHPTRITRMQGVILLLFMLGSMIEGFDIVIIAYTAPAISADWGISAGELGVVLSAGLLGMMLGAMLLSWVADRYGRRNVVSVTLFIAGIATAAVIHADTVAQLVVLRVVAGLSLGVLVATLPTLAGEFSPLRHRTLFVAVLIACASLGAVVGGLVSAAVIEDYGWQSIFFGAGTLTLLIAVLIQWLVPESPAFIAKRRPPGALERVNRTLAWVGQAPVAQLPPAAPATSQERATLAALFTPARRGTTLLAWTSFFFGFIVVYFITSWMPQILVNAGMSQPQAMQGTAVIPFGSIVGTVLLGWLARWWPLGRLIAGGFVLGALCIFAMSMVLHDLAELSVYAIWGMLFVIGVALMGAFSNLYTIVLTVYPVQVRSTGLGWAAGLGRGGAVLSPTLAGLLIATGLSMSTLFVYFAVPAFVVALCVSFIRAQELP